VVVRAFAIGFLIICVPVATESPAGAEPGTAPRKAPIQVSEISRPPPKPGELNLGTGTIVSTTGEIVTNAHVVAQCDKLVVLDKGGNEHPAQVVLNAWRGKDLALIRMTGGLPANAVLPGPIAFPPQGEVPQPGEAIRITGYSYVPGKPFNLTLSAGSVVQPAQGTGFAFAFRGPLDVGNSGGPLVDSRGHLVGLIAGRLVTANDIGVGFTADEVTEFLNAEGVNFERTWWVRPLPPGIVERIAQRATVGIKCTY
jgi:S1-C subfamily serine protease